MYIISDEVYERQVFDGLTSLPRITDLDGMFRRTATFMSLGKRFACTGWRTGIMIGPKELVTNTLKSHFYT